MARFAELSGLANRQQMKRSLDQTLAQSRRTYRPTALFLLDLDRFKSVNDTLCHQTCSPLLNQLPPPLLLPICHHSPLSFFPPFGYVFFLSFFFFFSPFPSLFIFFFFFFFS